MGPGLLESLRSGTFVVNCTLICVSDSPDFSAACVAAIVCVAMIESVPVLNISRGAKW